MNLFFKGMRGTVLKSIVITLVLESRNNIKTVIKHKALGVIEFRRSVYRFNTVTKKVFKILKTFIYFYL